MAMVHKLGLCPISEKSVVIAISSDHRIEAIEACHFAIDRLKATVPIWKKVISYGYRIGVTGIARRSSSMGVTSGRPTRHRPSPYDKYILLFGWMIAINMVEGEADGAFPRLVIQSLSGLI